jgi:hypothetical protein
MYLRPEHIGQEFVIAETVVYGRYRGEIVATLIRISEKRDRTIGYFRFADGSVATRSSDASRAVRALKSEHDKQKADQEAARVAREEFEKPLREQFAILKDRIDDPASFVKVDHLNVDGDYQVTSVPMVSLRVPLAWLAKNVHKFSKD